MRESTSYSLGYVTGTGERADAAPFFQFSSMATHPQSINLHEALLRQVVPYFSSNVLGIDYATVGKIIYPAPRYKTFLIPKRNGQFRIIQEPRLAVKELQVKVLAYLESVANPPKQCVHGFVKTKSIVSNAKRHLRERRPTFLLNVDLKDFFPSISFYRVRGVLLKPPFNFGHSVATVIAHLCTVAQRLPQGAPTSPFLSNLVCRALDSDLTSLAHRHRATYTRYADDITFSFTVREQKSLPVNICTLDSGVALLGDELVHIIQGVHHFEINPDKTRISSRQSRMEVTGITINQFTNVQRDFVDRVRGALHAWERYGYAAAQLEFERKITASRAIGKASRVWARQTRTRVPPLLKDVLRGRLLYIKMVRGPDDPLYTRLAEKYNRLAAAGSTLPIYCAPLPVSTIVRNAPDALKAVFVVEVTGNLHTIESKNTEPGYSQGTGFAYGNNRILVTCDHVLRFRLDDEAGTAVDCESAKVTDLEIVAKRPNSTADWHLKILHRDRGRDLAILKFVDEPPAMRYFTHAEVPIKKNRQGSLLGFPNWSPGRDANHEDAMVTNRSPQRSRAVRNRKDRSSRNERRPVYR